MMPLTDKLDDAAPYLAIILVAGRSCGMSGKLTVVDWVQAAHSSSPPRRLWQLQAADTVFGYKPI